jgi:hypothetical protein
MVTILIFRKVMRALEELKPLEKKNNELLLPFLDVSSSEEE